MATLVVRDFLSERKLDSEISPGGQVEDSEAAKALIDELRRKGWRVEPPLSAPLIEHLPDGRWKFELDGIEYVFREAKVFEERRAHQLALREDPLECTYLQTLITMAIAGRRILNGREEEIHIEELNQRERTWAHDLIFLWQRGSNEHAALRKKSLKRSATPSQTPAEISPGASAPS